MNLTNVSNLAKKISLPILVLVIIGALIFLIVFRLNKTSEPPPKPPIQAPALTQSPLIERAGTIKFDENLLKSKEKPTSLPVYQISQQTFDLTKATEIARSFGLSVEPQSIKDATLGEIYRFSSDQTTLSLNRFKLVYQENPQTQESTSSARKLFSTDDLNNQINQFLAQHGLTKNSISPSLGTVSFYKKKPTGGFEKIDNILDADKISTLISLKLEGYPFVDHNADQTPASLSMTQTAKVTSLSYRFLPSLQPQEKYPIKTIPEAAKEAAAGQGVIAGFIPKTLPIEGEVKIIKTASIVFSKANLAYYLPIPSPEILQPVYVFTGSAKTTEGEEGQISLIIPAIQKEIFSQP